MSRRGRSNLVIGVLLILFGVGRLAIELVPGLSAWVGATLGWPVFIVGVGLLLLMLGLLTGEPGMAVPACIVGGIGGLLYWQNATNNWETWSYLWTLIPGFVGVGVVLSGLLGEDTRRSLRDGGQLILISLVMFVIFGSLFGALGSLGTYWPALLILLGLVMLVRMLFRSR
jgi:hypothetical protein